MANAQNLIPNEARTPSERRENARKAGVASGVARRAKRDAREVARMVLSFTPEIPPQMLDTIRRMGMKGREKPDMRLISTLAIQQKAMKGDLACYKWMTEMAGETAEARMLEIKENETARRSGMPEESETEITQDEIRSKLDSMTDEELQQYENLCAKFGGEEEWDSGM